MRKEKHKKRVSKLQRNWPELVRRTRGKKGRKEDGKKGRGEDGKKAGGKVGVQ